MAAKGRKVDIYVPVARRLSPDECNMEIARLVIKTESIELVEPLLE